MKRVGIFNEEVDFIRINKDFTIFESHQSKDKIHRGVHSDLYYPRTGSLYGEEFFKKNAKICLLNCNLFKTVTVQLDDNHYPSVYQVIDRHLKEEEGYEVSRVYDGGKIILYEKKERRRHIYTSEGERITVLEKEKENINRR